MLMSIGSLANPQAYSIFFYLYVFAPVFPSADDAILYPRKNPHYLQRAKTNITFCVKFSMEKPRTISLSLPVFTMLCLHLYSDTCKILSGICFLHLGLNSHLILVFNAQTLGIYQI